MIRSLIMLLISGAALGDSVVSDNIRISSEALGYDLQYRVYQPGVTDPNATHGVLFVTDGPSYLNRNRLPSVLDELIRAETIEPLVVVFVDPRDPNKLRNNRRNSQFLCNADYLRFFEAELIPEIERSYPVATNRSARGIMGMSFGATNAACFGIGGFRTFSRLGMLSPANHPVSELLPAYEEAPVLPLKIFLSTGRPNDNTQANRQFHTILKKKGYEMEYVEVRQGHDWKNWQPLLDDLLVYLYGK